MADEPQVAPPRDPTVTLEDWCRDRSVSDTRVELLAAFHHTERQAGQLHDTAPAYAARYAAFATAPA